MEPILYIYCFCPSMMCLLVMISDYLEVNDSMITSLMMRHRTLQDTNTTLVENLTSMADQVKQVYLHMLYISFSFLTCVFCHI